MEPSPVAPPESPLRRAASPSPSAAPSAAVLPRRFARNPHEVGWFVCLGALGLVFGATLVNILVNRLQAQWAGGGVDGLVDGLWILSCLGILGAIGAIGREFVRFWRKRVSLEPAGLRVGTSLLPWAELSYAREAREFRAGAWFYHLEVAAEGGRRVWVTSGLIADYPGFRAALRAAAPQLPLILAPD